MDWMTHVGGSLWRSYWAGGPVMHLITVCSVLGAVAIFYKLFVFRHMKLDAPRFLERIRTALLNGDVAGATRTAAEHPGPVAAVVHVGLLKHGLSRDEIERSMENVALHQVGYLEKYLGMMATIVSLAPLLGFFGTVMGMIISFDEIARAGLNNPAGVARGISVALLTTAWGLIVAFVVQPFYNYFTGRVARFVRDMESAANVLIETYDEMDRMGTRA